jgi:hypothetical protein
MHVSSHINRLAADLPGRTAAPASPAGIADVTTAMVLSYAAAFLASAAASTMSEHFSPIMMQGALVLPLVSVGMIEASATRRPSMPCTYNSLFTTASASLPILQVPTG